MVDVELIYDRDCPNVSEARANLLRAFTAEKMPPRWTEWDRSDSASPDCARGYGSPAILVNGKDVAGAEPCEGMSCCRLYGDPAGTMQGAPPVSVIASALQAADDSQARHGQRQRRSGWLGSMATLPGIGAALLPAGICPVCWPAYAGVLGALGIGFLLSSEYLLPITAIFLLIAVGALGFKARTRRGFGPLAVGLAGAVLILLGKFVFAFNAAMYGGIVVLITASLWNAWPRKAAKIGGACPACAPEGQATSSPDSGANEV